MVSKEELEQKCREFEENEGRASFYKLAVDIVDEHPLQAAIIILATWNVSRFRFMVSDSRNLINLEEALENSKPILKRLRGIDFKGANFDEVSNDVKEPYSRFSRVKGVEYTGGSKVMHLLNRDLFVMWDSYIRDEYSYGNTPGDYVRFLKQMQQDFGHISWDSKEKPLAKAIDEYNYITISFPRIRKGKNKD